MKVIVFSWTLKVAGNGGGNDDVRSGTGMGTGTEDDSELSVSENSGGGSGIVIVVSPLSPFRVTTWPFIGVLEIAEEGDGAMFKV